MFEQTTGEAMKTADGSRDTQCTAPQPTGGARLIPAVRFGLRAAVLAGVIASVGGATTGMGGAIGALAGTNETTCCGGNAPAVVQTI